MRKKKATPVTRKDTSQKARKKAIVKKASLKAPKEGILYGIHYESLTEMYCLHWLNVLKNNGYVKHIERSPSFLLSDIVTSTYAVQLKKGSKAVTQTILRPHSYTPDFSCIFTKKALGVFCWDIDSEVKFFRHLLVVHKKGENEYLCHIEVKPDFSFAGKNEKAQNDMKWTYQKHKQFINMFKPDDRFSQTFTPKEYLLTGTGKDRRMKYIPRTFEDYLKTLKT